ncbi:mediator of RNA polymerase II transcription subunit 27 isoform X2 [Entelurus aequoreus]|uniref:mediator of RNA polymerase II transcription subunit 27 isoform X2 n=1 Tax=Entelurus aequoreus TaxID=161455 RepID=UPI002B1D1672|nr:mediator of RNA polymerase II transcription subunit 27 isoform X2 [Entelurus aequoreus]
MTSPARGGEEEGNMADVVSVEVNLDAFSHAISGIQALRSSVSRVFESLKDGMKNRDTLENREKQFIAEFQDNLQAVNRDLNELERLSGLVGRPSESHPLHNSGLLSLDPVQDKTPLYSQLLQAYKWSNKLQYHAGLASGLLNQQSLKRSANQMGASAKRRPKVQPSTLVLPPQYVDDVISRIGRMFPDMTIELFRPNGTSAVLLNVGPRLQRERLHRRRKAGHLDQVPSPSLPEGNGPRHHRPAALPAASDARGGGALLHDLAEELHQTLPVSLSALWSLPAGRTSAHVEGL